ncbi:MAG: hypothetical protein FWG50_01475 [Kiritimatiellaeota bacterium]|nr:hypothetical protein [Kiritimatiellota bacterium]
MIPNFYLPCLDLLSPEEMKAKLSQLRERKRSEQGLGDALRVFGASSELVKMDPQRRVRICDRLLRFAKIEDKVILAASVTCVQLWSPALYPEEEDVDQTKLAEAARLLGI